MFCVFPSLPNRIIPKREVYAAVDKPLKQTNKQTNTGENLKISLSSFFLETLLDHFFKAPKALNGYLQTHKDFHKTRAMAF